MSLMTLDKLEELKNITKKQWENAVNKWELTDEVILYEESKEILCRTACEWAGVPLKEEEVKERTACYSIG